MIKKNRMKKLLLKKIYNKLIVNRLILKEVLITKQQKKIQKFNQIIILVWKKSYIHHLVQI